MYALTNSVLVSINGAAPTYSTTLPVSVPFDMITNGTNIGHTLSVGPGTTVFLAGGAVQANQYLNGGSTAAVDLNSVWNGTVGEVNGTLGIGNGGTNNTVIGSAGSVVYSDGTKHTFTAVGSTGQVLSSNGAGAPTWINNTGGMISKGRIAGDGTAWSYTVTGLSLPSTATIVATVESLSSGANMAVTVTARTGSQFTVQVPIALAVGDYISWLIF